MFRNYNPPKFKLFDNGMRLISIANDLVSASQLGFKFGARQDPVTFSGMAHKWEHLLCRGASARAIAAIIKRNLDARATQRPVPISERDMNRMMRRYWGGSNGPNTNIYTVHGQTGFGHHDLFAPPHLRRVFPIMAGTVRDGMYDIRDMRNRDEAVISPRAFAVERGAVGNETAENDEWPGMIGFRTSLKELYAVNPARHWGDSDPEQLARVKMGTMKQWAQGWYVPSNMTVVIFGPSRNSAIRLVREVGLDEIPDWPSAKWSYDHSDDVPVLTGIKHTELQRAGSTMRHVCMLWPTETCTSRDALAIEVLANLLKDRLEDELREQNTEYPGGVYHPMADWDRTSSHGYITVQFSTIGDDAHCDRQIRQVLDVIEAIRNDHSDVFTEDVEDGRFYLADAYSEEYRFVPGKFCDRIVFAVANGDENLERCMSYYNDMLHVSPTRVRNAAIKYLHRDRYVSTVVRPAS